MMNAEPPRSCHLVAIPWPGRGHINAMMSFCRQLASRSTTSAPILISFIITEEWLGFLGTEPAPPPNVQLTPIPNVIPSEVGRGSDYDGFVDAVLTKMEGPVEQLLDSLEPVDGIVADTYLPWVVPVGNRRGVPVHSLFPMAASFFYAIYNFDRTAAAANRHVAVKRRAYAAQVSRLTSTAEIPSMIMSSQPCPCRHVVAVPYPGRGHINPMMNLCHLLAARTPNIFITIVVTEEWLGFILASDPLLPANVQLRSIPNVIPSEVGRGRDFVGFLEAVYTRMEGPFESFLDRFEQPVIGIVADTYLPWAVDVGNRRGIPVHSLFTMSATFFSRMYHIQRPPANDVTVKRIGEEEADEPAAYIPGLNSLQLADFHHVVTSGKPLQLALQALSMVPRAQSMLFTSFYELEAGVFDYLRAKIALPVYPIGPSIPYMMQEQKCAKANGSSTDYIDWLNSQPRKSVLYVSLGSFLSVSGPQMDELVKGLRLSGTSFLWVARSDSQRLQEMAGDMGMLVPWCNQLKVLQHPSVGGFLTHCGWNSTLEGVFSGLSMLTFPIFWDQPIDSKLIVDEWKIGLNMNRGAGREGVIGREEIADAVKKVMDSDGSEGKDMRRRVDELSKAAHRAIEAGGSSFSNLDCFIRDITIGASK